MKESPTEILLSHINLTKRQTNKLISDGGLNCLTRGVLGLMEAGGGGDMKAIDLIINRVDGLLNEKTVVKPIVVAVSDFSDLIEGEATVEDVK